LAWKLTTLEPLYAYQISQRYDLQNRTNASFAPAFGRIRV
jgi:hypothetical protein